MENVKEFNGIKQLDLRRHPSVESTQELLEFIKSQVTPTNTNGSSVPNELKNFEKQAKNFGKPLPSIKTSKKVQQLSILSQSCPESELEFPWDKHFQNKKMSRANSVDSCTFGLESNTSVNNRTLRRCFTLPPLMNNRT